MIKTEIQMTIQRSSVGHLTIFKADISGVTTCGAKGRSGYTVVVNKGESYRFNTNTAANYGPNVVCLVTYKRQGSCKKMSISCDKFSLDTTAGFGAQGDNLRVIIEGRKTQTFCCDNGPSLETKEKTMKLFFTSNWKNHGAGASCTVACV